MTPTRVKPRVPWLLAVLCLAALTATAARAASLAPGLYQPADPTVTCRLSPLNDGSLLLEMWSGAQPMVSPQGFALLARLTPTADRASLVGNWLGLPGSCCQAQGRLSLVPVGPDGFRFGEFTPLPDADWRADPGQVFHLTRPEPAEPALDRWAGVWTVQWWHNDLLPSGEVADYRLDSWELTPDQDGLVGAWRGQEGNLRLSRGQGGALALTYTDGAQDFQLSAQLHPQDGGLVLAGVFESNLGSGRLRLVRAGLPAAPQAPEAAGDGELSGLWVDPRTGSDFVRIRGGQAGFVFTAYGGDLAQPRYLAQGSAQPAGADAWRGEAQDQKGHCCGNQGRLRFQHLDPDRLQVSSTWWPLGAPDPGTPEGQPYTLVRQAPAQPAAGPEGAKVLAARPGLPARAEGAARVTFQTPEQSPGRPQTLFNQGGYGQALELGLDASDHPVARLATEHGYLNLRGEAPLAPDQEYRLTLMYQADGQTSLRVDDQVVAQGDLGGPWTGSRAPYLLGHSRWPHREFQGRLGTVELWPVAQGPEHGLDPTVVLGAVSAGTGQDAASAEPPQQVVLTRLWHPGRLLHAYATDPARLAELVRQGYQVQEPVIKLWTGEEAGRVPLYLHRETSSGRQAPSLEAQPPQGWEAGPILGYLSREKCASCAPLYALVAKDAPLPTGGRFQDTLLTSRETTPAQAARAGYAPAKPWGHAPGAGEKALAWPLLPLWEGLWSGEGWGRFLIRRQGDDLHLFWYYADLDGPNYLGAYRLEPDGVRATGLAVGNPGPMATYYRHQLHLTQTDQGPRLTLQSWRLAAPLDDGRLVRFKEPALATTVLTKAPPESQEVNQEEQKRFDQLLQGPGPQQAMEQALKQAAAEGRLLER